MLRARFARTRVLRAAVRGMQAYACTRARTRREMRHAAAFCRYMLDVFAKSCSFFSSDKALRFDAA